MDSRCCSNKINHLVITVSYVPQLHITQKEIRNGACGSNTELSNPPLNVIPLVGKKRHFTAQNLKLAFFITLIISVLCNFSVYDYYLYIYKKKS